MRRQTQASKLYPQRRQPRPRRHWLLAAGFVAFLVMEFSLVAFGSSLPTGELWSDSDGSVVAQAASVSAPPGSVDGGPTDTPSSTPTPVPSPTPAPWPASGGQEPSPTPSLQTIFPVPAWVDATGATDASAALTTFVASVPDGSTIEFARGGVYRVDVGLTVDYRNNLTFEGNGATIRSAGGSTPANGLFIMRWDFGITIRDFNLVGNDPKPGIYQPYHEWAHGVFLRGGANFEIANLNMRGLWGDCLYVSGWTDTVAFHDSTCASAGRNGVAITAGRNVVVQQSSFGKIGGVVFDVEPNDSSGGATDVRFMNNSVGSFGVAFFGAQGAAGSTVSGVTVTGNRVSGGSLESRVTVARRSAIAFTNNVGTVSQAGPILQFAHVDGLTMFGNVQPLSRGRFAVLTDCTKVITR